ncbi:selenocysteine-specific translation elongation factor [Planococcus antarcticus DSM 14505]|uniref:Selenocysteine-specific elongation factor n=1 Tax=Planococcus antarcticus DSM 14505 TaxID=1185653 RepID=A0AA87IKV6_9BACL|nr:selenocysteine-specific translation elongation factor [Planococcus antarcticus]EIM06319.1 selenocysteine-specific translation elongation factor [Planococcus antarcticus DSM 14505]
MEERYFTVGMAGHIDHGKTSLTKALTNVETDRLKEEKERGISIESGYAPLNLEAGVSVSIVDVPGHERFIRQMIAGVAGIDLVVLVVAADEGIMPQTEEHLEILQFLGVERCIVAISKIDRVDEVMLELVKDDVKERLLKTAFHEAPYVALDSLSGKGIDELKQIILTELKAMKFRDAYGSFRLPIDQVFTVQGQGTVVRGTVYEGVVRKASQLLLLPGGIFVKARQIQVHHEESKQARAGQRTAINLSGIERTAVKRGDVLVDSDHFLVTDTIDVALQVIGRKFAPLKQRTAVRLHIGTSEVMGKIVFFDRKELEQTPDEVLCQIRLDEKIVVRRGDRFILRRPSPMETIGGGWVIQPNGDKYRFGNETIDMLRHHQQGTPQDLVIDALNKYILLDLKQLMQQTSLAGIILKETLKEGLASRVWLEVSRQGYSLTKTFIKIKDELLARLQQFHEDFPMRTGMGKAELVQSVSATYPKSLLEYSLNLLLEQNEIQRSGQFVALTPFSPNLPKKWHVRMEQIIGTLEKDGFQAKKWEDYFIGSPLPKLEIAELTSYLLESGQAYRLREDTIIHHTAFENALNKLRQQTGPSFDLKQAKDILNLSRKYMIPFLELLDGLNYTRRTEDQRHWMEDRT